MAHDDQPTAGRSILLSYEKLLSFERHMDRLNTKMDACLALKGQVDDHELRITALEQIQAADRAVAMTWHKIGTILLTVVTSAIGGGALTFVLPKLWGG